MMSCQCHIASHFSLPTREAAATPTRADMIKKA
jgi:hypothetical protein